MKAADEAPSVNPEPVAQLANQMAAARAPEAGAAAAGTSAGTSETGTSATRDGGEAERPGDGRSTGAAEGRSLSSTPQRGVGVGVDDGATCSDADFATYASIAATLALHVRRDHPPHHPPVKRDAHPKHHGTVQAELTVDPDIPPSLQHGVFATPGRRYQAWIRFSNAFRVRHDMARDARGMAVKLLGVEGVRPPPRQMPGVLAGEPTAPTTIATPATTATPATPAAPTAAAAPAAPTAPATAAAQTAPAASASAATSATAPASAPASASAAAAQPAREPDTTQDFLMVTHPAFFAATAADFLDFPAAVAAQGSAIGSALRVFRYFFRLHPFRCRWRGFLALRRSTVRTPSALTLRYFGQTPYRLGPHIVKFGVRPHRQLSRNERFRFRLRSFAFRFSALPFAKFPQWRDYLRDELFHAVAASDTDFDFLVQLRTDPEHMPLDNATVVWDEQRAPFVKVATLHIPRQPLDTAGIVERLSLGEHLSFTPWHTLAAHEPLGSVNEARRVVYETISSLRHGLNGKRRREPAPGESASDYLRSL